MRSLRKIKHCWLWIVILSAISTMPVRAQDCHDGEALIADRLLEPARQAFIILLQQTSPPTCAYDGLRTVTEEQVNARVAYELGRDYRKRKDFENARRAFIDALAIDISLTAAASNLIELSERPETDAATEACATGEKLLQAHLAAPAEKTFTVLLEQVPPEACAREGLDQAKRERRRARASYELGLAYREGGALEKAQQAFLDALKIDASLTEAVSVLKVLPELKRQAVAGKQQAIEAGGQGALSQSKKLLQAGFLSEAQEKLEAAVEKGADPRGEPLLESLADQRLPQWRELLLTAAPTVRTVLEVGLIVLVCILVLYRWPLQCLRTPRMSITALDGTGLDEDAGGKLAVLLENRLHETASKTSWEGIGFVNGEIEAQRIPTEVGQALPLQASWMQAFPALFNWLNRRPAVKVSGCLHPENELGLGATLLIEKNKVLVDSQSFRLRELDPRSTATGTDAYYELCVWMASWLMFRLPRRYSLRRARHELRRFTSYQLSILGTEDWRSYAWFEKGCQADTEGRDDAARDHYRKALARDPLMRGAKVNLGRSLSREEMYEVARGQEEEAQQPERAQELDAGERPKSVVLYEEAERLLAQAVQEAKNTFWWGWWDAPSYSAAYSHAVLMFSHGEASEEDRMLGFGEARRLRKRIRNAKCFFFWVRPLYDYLVSIQAEAYAMHAFMACHEDMNDPEAARRYLRSFYEPTRARVANRLNRGLSRLAGQAPSWLKKRTWVREGWNWTRGALRRQSAALPRPARLSVRARYNVASALSSLAEKASFPTEDEKSKVDAAALDYLTSALRAGSRNRKNLMTAGKQGPLSYLYNKYKTQIQRVLDDLPEPDSDVVGPEPLPLSRIPSIGNHAEKLKELGIDTPEQLLVRLLSSADRAQLSVEAGVSPDTILAWARLLDLIELEGLSLDHIVLLSRAGYRSRRRLRGEQDAALTRHLADVARAEDLLAPQADRVASWIVQAQRPSLLHDATHGSSISRLLSTLVAKA